MIRERDFPKPHPRTSCVGISPVVTKFNRQFELHASLGDARVRLESLTYPLAFKGIDGSSATLTHTWTWGVPRKCQTNVGPSSRQLSHTPSLPKSPDL